LLGYKKARKKRSFQKWIEPGRGFSSSGTTAEFLRIKNFKISADALLSMVTDLVISK